MAKEDIERDSQRIPSEFLDTRPDKPTRRKAFESMVRSSPGNDDWRSVVETTLATMLDVQDELQRGIRNAMVTSSRAAEQAETRLEAKLDAFSKSIVVEIDGLISQALVDGSNSVAQRNKLELHEKSLIEQKEYTAVKITEYEKKLLEKELDINLLKSNMTTVLDSRKRRTVGLIGTGLGLLIAAIRIYMMTN